MKNLVKGFAVAMLFVGLGAATSAVVNAASNDCYYVYHYDAKGNAQVIAVGASAYDAHIAHGDTYLSGPFACTTK